MKVHPVEGELLRADGRTGRQHVAKLIVAFRSFANAAESANRHFEKSAGSLKQHLCLGHRVC